MAAVRTLISGALAPVGQPVRTRFGQLEAPNFPGYTPIWTASGTAALVLALQLARTRRPDVRAPQVLLPAYGCPDLVSAAVASGVRPVLVDIERDSPAMSLDALAAAWGEDVIAVVAVNFLGIRERLTVLNELAAERRALLIEDCAQWYPDAPLESDAVVLSFGRGKPVNLLGGGALLVRGEPAGVELPGAPARSGAQWFKLRALAFNWATKPAVYAWSTRAPLLRIGETRYRPFMGMAGMDPERLPYLAPNARDWLERPRWREEAVSRALAGLDAVSLPLSAGGRAGRLLRYPLLARTPSARDRALLALNDRGLGASPLYGCPVNRVADAPPDVAAQGPFENARQFAERLLTLPLHDRVTSRHLQEAVGVLVATFGTRPGTSEQRAS